MKIRDFFVPTSRNNFKAILLRSESIALVTLLMFVFDSLIGVLPSTMTSAQLDMNSLVYLHNKERTQVGLNTLDLNSLLITSASNKAKAMLDSDCWDHYCPPGVSPWTFFNQAGYQYIHAGENLGEGFSDNNSLMRAWMNSPTHRANVIKPEYRELGLGFASGEYQNQEDNTIAVVHFGAREQTTPVPTPTPTPIPVTPTPINTPVVTPNITQVPTPIVTPVIIVTSNPTPISTPTQTPAPIEETLTPTIQPTSKPTTIETFNEERNPLNALDAVSINYPLDKKVYSDPITKISGNVDTGITEVKLFINNNLITTKAVSDGKYIFESNQDTTIKLYEGSYDVKVVGYDKKGEELASAPVINFSIKLDAPILSQDDVKVEEIAQESDELNVVISYLPKDIIVEAVVLKIDDKEIKGVLNDSIYEFKTTKNSIDAAKTIVLGITDNNDKQFELELNKITIQNDISKMILKLDFPEEGENSFETMLGIPSADFLKFNFEFLSLKGKVNLFVLIFLLLLFIIDYIVINKLIHAKDQRNTHNHHLSVGLIVVLIILTLLSSGVGSVAVGLTSG
ncbi:hypothetical protein KBD45_04525 [Candidatus Dojkabacteria bacterium]|nr:hypothetical protein [Candidatus Dojkabacteria bacterium]